MTDLFYKPKTIMHILEIVSPAIFCLGMYINISMWRQGKAPSLKKKPNFGMMFKALIFNVLLQTQILKLSKIRWLMHMLIFYGFMGLAATYWWPWFFKDVLPLKYFTDGPGIMYHGFVDDFFGMLLLAGTTIAIVRRFIVKPKIVDTMLQDTVAVVGLFTIAVLGFLCEGARIALETPDDGLKLSFIGYAVSLIFGDGDSTKSIASVIWTIHMLLSFALIAYIPYSKLLHIITSPTN